jgi:hypothetical protein
VKFVIDYAKWRCGRDGFHRLGEGDTKLLNKEGYMCCLGQVELQLGLSEADIFDTGTPSVTCVENILTEPLDEGDCEDSDSDCLYELTELSIDAIEINDNTKTTPAEKMVALKELFAEHGHEIEFINVPQEQQQ